MIHPGPGGALNCRPARRPVFSRLVTRRTFTTWDCFGVATFEDCTVHSERSENLHCEYLRFVSSGFFFFFQF